MSYSGYNPFAGEGIVIDNYTGQPIGGTRAGDNTASSYYSGMKTGLNAVPGQLAANGGMPLTPAQAALAQTNADQSQLQQTLALYGGAGGGGFSSGGGGAGGFSSLGTQAGGFDPALYGSFKNTLGEYLDGASGGDPNGQAAYQQSLGFGGVGGATSGGMAAAAANQAGGASGGNPFSPAIGSNWGSSAGARTQQTSYTPPSWMPGMTSGIGGNTAPGFYINNPSDTGSLWYNPSGAGHGTAGSRAAGGATGGSPVAGRATGGMTGGSAGGTSGGIGMGGPAGGRIDQMWNNVINAGTDEISEAQKAAQMDLNARAEAMGGGRSGDLMAGNRQLDTGFAGQKANLARDVRTQAEQTRQKNQLQALGITGQTIDSQRNLSAAEMRAQQEHLDRIASILASNKPNYSSLAQQAGQPMFSSTIPNNQLTMADRYGGDSNDKWGGAVAGAKNGGTVQLGFGNTRLR